MNWKQKAWLQNLVARLPSSLSYNVHYFIQRRVGGLRSRNPISRLAAGIGILDSIARQGQSATSKIFLEIGTGWCLNLPIAFWLCGASKTITVDLNPYLKAELVVDDLTYIRDNQQRVKALFRSYAQEPIFLERFDQLIASFHVSLDRLLEMLNVQYLAPADATCLDLPSQSVDYHVSSTVFEHIPPEILVGILLEGKRLLREGGLFVHRVDLSDHFSHSDRSISAVNFLQFSAAEWEYYAGNRYMYQNRLRVDDFADMFSKLALKIVAMDTKIEPRALQELQSGRLSLDERFKTKNDETNATFSAMIVAPVSPNSWDRPNLPKTVDIR